MADNLEVSTRIKETLDLAAKCFEAEKSEEYEVLSEQLEELESLARATVQAQIDYRPLVSKLEKGNPLTPDELNTLKLLMIGDADYDLKYDDEFDHYKGELKRIVDEIRRLQATDLDIGGLMRLGVLCREASSLIIPTGHYLEQKERVRNFQEATRDPIDAESGKFLANIIREMITP